MTRTRRHGFRFLGFVALADTLFAVSAGLLLLNPIQFAPPTPPAPPQSSPRPPVAPPREPRIVPDLDLSSLDAEIVDLEKQLTELEASLALVESGIRQATGAGQP